MSVGTLVNFGCGSLFRSGWQNYDIAPVDSSVEYLDATKEWPIPNGTVDMFYCSHMLEHIPPHKVNSFLFQVWNVLRPGGVLRIVVPDLAQIASSYLEAYEKARNGGSAEKLRHQWMVIELIDQIARQYNDGGEMYRFLLRNGEEGLALARQRFGLEMAQPLRWNRSMIKEQYIRKVSDMAQTTDEEIFKRRDTNSLQDIGLYRTSGEPHLWMYDEVSLTDLLGKIGFTRLGRRSAIDSCFEEFHIFSLDADELENPRKPDSIYFEGVKPE